MLSSHLDLPREVYLNQVFHIFSYLKKYHNTKLVFDTSDMCVKESYFELEDWTSSEFNNIQGNDELPPNMPQPRVLGFIISAKVYSEHAYDTLTR